MKPNENAPMSWAECYRSTLLDNVIPFWLKHGWDKAYGGFVTSLDRNGTMVDTDKSIWFQGRSAWMFATLYNTVAPEPEWRVAAQSAFEFLLSYGSSPTDVGPGKLYFTVTRDGKPLRMRRYLYSEAFAAIAGAALARATGDGRYAIEAIRYFDACLRPFRDPN
ncbi:MAG: AGE family epimerase/isomerase, partial [Pirellula sp.]